MADLAEASAEVKRQALRILLVDVDQQTLSGFGNETDQGRSESLTMVRAINKQHLDPVDVHADEADRFPAFHGNMDFRYLAQTFVRHPPSVPLDLFGGQEVM